MSDLRFAYGTNGLADHRLEDALWWLAELGYDGVALTLDHQHLDPLADDLAARVRTVRRLLDDTGLAVVVETGARFVLDPRRKHGPTLLDDEGRRRRLDLLRTAIDVAAELGAPVVHLWSGRRPTEVAADLAWDRVVEGCTELLDAAEQADVHLAFEPEPGMLVDTIATYERLLAALGHHPRFGLTLDVGHCVCLEPEPVPTCIHRIADRLRHVQIEDMRRGVHEHLPFGDGELDLPTALAALRGVGYGGLVSVELPRHSHTAHTVVPQSLHTLRGADREVVVT